MRRFWFVKIDLKSLGTANHSEKFEHLSNLTYQNLNEKESDVKELATVDERDLEISLQFSFHSPESMPQFLEDLQEETNVIAVAREDVNSQGTGVSLTGDQFREKKVDLRKLPASLLRTDYELVGAWKQSRINKKKDRSGKWSFNKPYWMIRFRFRHKSGIAEYRTKVGEDGWQKIMENRPLLLGELVSICSLAFWQMRAWRNPYYKDGIPLPGVHAISLNFEGRQPLYEWNPPGEHDLPPQFKPEFTFNIF